MLLWWSTKVRGKPQYVTEYSSSRDFGPRARSSDYQRLVFVSCRRKSNNVIRSGELCKWMIFLVSLQLHQTFLINHIYNPDVSQDLEIYHKLIRNRGIILKSRIREKYNENKESYEAIISYITNVAIANWLNNPSQKTLTNLQKHSQIQVHLPIIT